MRRSWARLATQISYQLNESAEGRSPDITTLTRYAGLSELMEQWNADV